MIDSPIVTYGSYPKLNLTTETSRIDSIAYIPRFINGTPSLAHYENLTIELAKNYAWHNSPVPMWSSILKKLKYFESQYDKSSSAVFEAYKTNQAAQLGIPSKDLREWVNSYVMYAY
jgi:hypothetical protein